MHFNFGCSPHTLFKKVGGRITFFSAIVLTGLLTACEISPDQVKFAAPDGPGAEDASGPKESLSSQHEASDQGQAERH